MEPLVKFMPEAVYENEIMYPKHWVVVYGETCFNVFFFLSKAKLVEPLCVALYLGRSMLLLRHFWALITQILKHCLHGSWDLVSDWLEPSSSHCCASCVSFWIVTGWQVWQAHTPPENALCQVFTLLQQLWCLHPSLPPPWVHTAWVPWTWGLCLEASTPLAHVEPWWGGDWKRKTSKAHVSEMLTNVFWPEKTCGSIGILDVRKPIGRVFCRKKISSSLPCAKDHWNDIPHRHNNCTTYSFRRG